MTATLLDAIDSLERFYGALPQPPDDPFGVYVWEVLGAQNTPTRRDAALAALRRVPALTPDALARVPQAKLDAVLTIAGPLREQRQGALTGGIELFRRRPHLPGALRGPIRPALRAARGLPHVAAAAADRVLLFGGRQPVAAVDDPAARVLSRLGYVDAGGGAVRRGRRLVRGAANGRVAVLQRACLYLSHHGLSTCLASGPHCGVCPLARDCRSRVGAA